MNQQVSPTELEAYHQKLIALQRSQTIAGMDRRAKQGLPNNLAPLGYLNMRVRGINTKVLDTNTAPLIKEAFKLAATGKKSLSQILKMITEKGLVSKNGKPLCRASLYVILTNPFYAGMVRYKGELIPGQHQAIITDEILEQCRKSLRQGKKFRSNSK